MSRLSPVNQARWARFRHNRRGYWSLWIFLVLFGLSLCSELIANDKPLLVRYDGSWYFPLLKNYSESDFGGPLASQAELPVSTLLPISPSLLHPPGKTGWERMPTAAMCWHAFSMARGSRFCLA